MPHHLPVIHPFRLRPRLAVSIVLGIVVYIFLPLLPSPALPAARFLVAWNVGLCAYLVLVAIMMTQANLADIRARSAREDEGGLLILALTLVAAIASLVGIIVQLSLAKNLHGAALGFHIVLAFLTVFLSWSFMHVMFALHYAHSYHAAGREEAHPALEFPGRDEPDYWDFIYFSLVIGATAQTADIGIADRFLRRIATLHCVTAFFFNTTILALMVNIGASLI